MAESPAVVLVFEEAITERQFAGVKKAFETGLIKFPLLTARCRVEQKNDGTDEITLVFECEELKIVVDPAWD